MENKKIASIADIRNLLNRYIDNIQRNNLDPYEIPLYVKEDWHRYPISLSSLSFGDGVADVYATLQFRKSEEVVEVLPDSRPYVGGEYWVSRGPSDYDCSGFVKSKLAGERLLRLVKFVLETDEPESFLDYREREPTWIQFKFFAKEFDVELLDKLTRENEDIVNEEILRKCVK